MKILKEKRKDIKLIKKFNKKKEKISKSYIFTCDKCGSKIELSNKELLTNGIKYTCYFECPVCSNHVVELYPDLLIGRLRAVIRNIFKKTNKLWQKLIIIQKHY